MAQDIQPLLELDNFGLIKGGTDSDERRMYGFGSSPARDYDEERILQKGLDIKPLASRGWVNFDHNRLNTIGWVEKADFRPNPLNPDMAKGVYTEFRLFNDDPIAERVWTMAKAIEASKCPRSFGISLEGVRGHKRGDVVMSATVYGIAVTPYAKNLETSARAFMKGIIDCGIAEDSPGSDNFPLFDIDKAICSGTDVGGTTQTGGAAIRKEVLVPDLVSIVPSAIPKDLKEYTDEERIVIKRLADRAEQNGWKLSGSDAAILTATIKRLPIARVIKALNFNL